MLDRQSRAAAIRGHDHLRRSPRRFGGPGGFKEWHHVLVETDELSLLVNFNLTDDMWSPRPAADEVARLIVLARVADDRGWRGEAERFAPADVAVAAGGVDATFGASRLRFDGERYHVAAALRSGAIAADLALRPAVDPCVFTNQRLGSASLLSWFLVPRLTATGAVTVDGRTLELRDAPAYHDHNWGHYLWGDDFVWEWAWACGSCPEGPWSAVFWRLADRHRRRATSSGLLVELPGGPPLRFLDDEVRVTGHGLHRPSRALRLPAVMALLCPGTHCDAPETIVLEAARGGAGVDLRFSLGDLAQIIVPNEADDDGATTLNEFSGRCRMSAAVDGRALAGEGRCVVELLRA